GEENWEIGEFTAYNATIEQCGKADGITASGKKVKQGRTLACPPEYKLGTKIEIEGRGVYECQDRGGAIKGNRFDIYFDSVAEAKQFGRQKINYKIIK
ncbi:MAG: 3D domain-containing protein, partial [Candidatus Caldatribacteriota bacterium]|nr:3D domain-containing protein [Candidatus Caldatribacteriota bacterium]